MSIRRNLLDHTVVKVRWQTGGECVVFPRGTLGKSVRAKEVPGSMPQFMQNARKKPNQISVAAAHVIHTFIPRTLFPFWAEGLESHGRDPNAWLRVL